MNTEGERKEKYMEQVTRVIEHINTKRLILIEWILTRNGVFVVLSDCVVAGVVFGAVEACVVVVVVVVRAVVAAVDGRGGGVVAVGVIAICVCGFGATKTLISLERFV